LAKDDFQFNSVIQLIVIDFPVNHFTAVMLNLRLSAGLLFRYFYIFAVGETVFSRKRRWKVSLILNPELRAMSSIVSFSEIPENSNRRACSNRKWL